MGKIIKVLILLFLFSINSINAQHGLTKAHITKAYNSIKLTANYPDTWSLSDYAIYKGKRDRKCIDMTIIEIKAKNGFGVPINASFLCYFIRGRMFWYMECEYKPSFINLFTEENANNMIDLAVETSIEIERTISKDELCLTSIEEDQLVRAENERIAKEQEQERQRKEQEQEDLIVCKNIDRFLNVKDTKSALQEYKKLNKSSSFVLDKIQNMVKSNNAEIGRLLSEKKIEQALDLYLITGRDDELLNKIKSALAEKYPEPQTPLDNSKLLSVLSSNAISELKNIAFDSKRQLFLVIQKNGQAMLKNGSTILKQFKAEDRFISTNSYKDISFPVDANYSLLLEVDSIKSSIFGLEFSKDFLQFKSDIDAKKLAYYYVKNGDKTLILSKVSDGNDVSKKYPGAQRIYNFEFSNEYSGKQARLINTCPLKVNGQAFSMVNFKSKNFITTFKKFK